MAAASGTRCSKQVHGDRCLHPGGPLQIRRRSGRNVLVSVSPQPSPLPPLAGLINRNHIVAS
ncbi:hypothetical protein NQZ68_032052 [Dissostichus eleginoides]|nr:hypothetical protein NQZ68_032052 [Dissostichus eleginoides]